MECIMLFTSKLFDEMTMKKRFCILSLQLKESLIFLFPEDLLRKSTKISYM